MGGGCCGLADDAAGRCTRLPWIHATLPSTSNTCRNLAAIVASQHALGAGVISFRSWPKILVPATPRAMMSAS